MNEIGKSISLRGVVFRERPRVAPELRRWVPNPTHDIFSKQAIMIWFTSDLHFGHQNVIDYCARPFENVDEMNKFLLKRWNATVADDDIVYVLGDLALMKAGAFLPIGSGLKGRKILIKGNHDSYSAAQYSSMGFLVFDEAVITLWNKRIRLSHYPHWPAAPELEDPNDLRYPDRRPPKDGKVLFHGHVHKKWVQHSAGDVFEINVGVDVWNYQPVAASTLEKWVCHR
jgi:calcineurin-like phosphoesterase family protein